MKKILLIIACIVGIFSFVSCSDDDDKSTSDSGLALVKSEVKFSCNPSEGYIEFTSPTTVTASSSEEWCTASVNGSKVVVDVTANTDLEGRNAVVTISAGGSSINVPVSQSGRIFRIYADDDMFYVSGKQPETVTIPVKSTGNVSVTSSSDWIKATVADGKVLIDCSANTGNMRIGKFSISNGTDDYDFSVFQTSKNGGFDGSYTAYYYNTRTSKLVPMDVALEANEDGTGYNLTGILGFKIPLKLDAENGYLVLSNMNYIGDYSVYNCYNVNTLSNGSKLINSITSTNKVYDIYFEFDIDDEDGSIGLFMSDDSPAASQGFYPYSIYIFAFQDGSGVGTLLNLAGFQMYVNPEE